MAVRAYRTITADGGGDYVIQYTFECGQFDLMQENDPGIWTEIWRDCDLGTKSRRTLVPFASGIKGIADVEVNLADSRQKHRKYFQASDDSFTTDLDLSDVNGGILPAIPCAWMEVYQNGKKLPCEGYTVDYTTPKVVINSEWTVPGASYEIIFWATPYGGVSTPGT